MCSCEIWPRIGVSITAGAMQLTRTPLPATSFPIAFVRAITAAFAGAAHEDVEARQRRDRRVQLPRVADVVAVREVEDVHLGAARTQPLDGRAAELASLPDDTILEIYTALRPRRSSAHELEAWAVRLEELGAPANAEFVR